MGNWSFDTDKGDDGATIIDRNSFAYDYVIGRGGFGKVWKVLKK